MENFIEILQDLLAESNLSLRQIEKEANIDHAQFNRLLNGGTMRIATAMKLAKYFDCSLDYLFGLDSHKNTVRYATYDYDLTDFVKRYQELLARNKISHRKFCREHFINSSIVSHWNYGHAPQLNILYLVAKELGGSIDELIGRY